MRSIMTRVLAVSSSYPLSESDTTAPFVRSICRGLSGHGCDVSVVLPAHEELSWPGRDGPVEILVYRYIPFGWRRFQVWGYAGGLRSDMEMKPEARIVAPAALAATAARLLDAARNLEPDVLHAHWVVPSGVPAAVVSVLTGTPLVVSLHGSDVYLAERSRTAGWAARGAFRRASAVTACSRDLARRAEALGADPDDVHVIPYGVDMDRFRPTGPEDERGVRQELGLDSDAAVILAVGRLVAKKGFVHLVDAVGMLADENRDVHLLLAGGGGGKAALRRRAREREVLDRVHFLGDVPRPRMPALYREATVLAVPSVDARGNVDGLPNVLLEGLASGLPVVASRIAGIPDVVRHGENGLLAEPGDPEDLAEALRHALDDGALRDRIGRAARRDVEERLNWSAVTDRYAQVLSSASRSLGGRRS